MKTVAFTTLGCRVNQYDTDAMKGLFLQNNYEAVDFDEKADIYVLSLIQMRLLLLTVLTLLLVQIIDLKLLS